MVSADVAVHLIRGEGNIQIVGNESGFFIRKVEIRLAEVGEEKTQLHTQQAEGGVPPTCGIIRRMANDFHLHQ